MGWFDRPAIRGGSAGDALSADESADAERRAATPLQEPTP